MADDDATEIRPEEPSDRFSQAPRTASSTDRYGILSRSTLLRHTLFAVAGILLAWLMIKQFSPATNQELQLIPAYVCAAIGLTLLVGLSGQISLGHGAFMMVGAYTFALLWPKWQLHPNLTMIGAFAAAVVVSAVAGGIVGVAAARLRGPYLAGATLALAVGLPSMTQYEKLSSHLKGSQGISIPSANAPANSGFDFVQWPLFIGVICSIVLLWFTANLMRSRVGRSMRAVRDDEVAASLSGLSVPGVQVLAFVVSAAWAGLGGALYALALSNASPAAFSVQLSLTLLAAVVIGGLGSLSGAVLGSVFVVMLTNYWAQNLSDALSISSDKVANNLPLLIYGVLLALAMLVAPGGIVGSLRRLIALVRPAR
ncbi:MAG TPA: branched-chain amino acid ABC transporter permease [Mycobacteriales bacterium]|jgi:branched-chain amino acid transport system permease protein|nr:branched-chain amino acid ABC transporter permease [Mycobacteriales bacterium]